ncbi:hypothetical protein J2X90_000740 [Variovorax paradoxus]|uniref:hypothetical protein n=1 Tax=Variovorax paradoxus TaxID=34073 RepID=UPI002788F216|nr:hypothetical protein [Variovorax paradoxus]MDQ0022954.1 hypothetical protein [Variovorax paradoxus]
MSAQINRITGGGLAVIDGKSTGLAGCSDSAKCERADYCLRADMRLSYRASNLHEGKCYSFIAVHHQGTAP